MRQPHGLPLCVGAIVATRVVLDSKENVLPRAVQPVAFPVVARKGAVGRDGPWQLPTALKIVQAGAVPANAPSIFLQTSFTIAGLVPLTSGN